MLSCGCNGGDGGGEPSPVEVGGLSIVGLLRGEIEFTNVLRLRRWLLFVWGISGLSGLLMVVLRLRVRYSWRRGQGGSEWQGTEFRFGGDESRGMESLRNKMGFLPPASKFEGGKGSGWT